MRPEPRHACRAVLVPAPVRFAATAQPFLFLFFSFFLSGFCFVLFQCPNGQVSNFGGLLGPNQLIGSTTSIKPPVVPYYVARVRQLFYFRMASFVYALRFASSRFT